MVINHLLNRMILQVAGANGRERFGARRGVCIDQIPRYKMELRGCFPHILVTKCISKVVSTHRTGTHPEQPLPTGYNGIPCIIG